MWKKILIAIGFLGSLLAAIFAVTRRNDGRGNNSGIDEQLGKARDLDKREGSALERERDDLGTEKTIIDRDRSLLEELQKRHPGK